MHNWFQRLTLFTLFSIFYRYGADITLTDCHGNNILHSVVLLTIDYLQEACEMYRYIMENIDNQTSKQLHGACNVTGLTVLELAAEHCLPEILHLILTTDHVYRFRLSQQGVLTKYEYRIPLHGSETFLQRLCNATKKQLARYTESSFLLTEPMKTILAEMNQQHKSKIYGSLAVTNGYFLLYLVYLYFYLTTHAVPPIIFTVVMLCYLCGWISLDLIHNCANSSFLRGNIAKWKAGKTPYAINIGFGIPTVIFWFLMLTLCIVELVGINNMTIRSSLYSVTSGLSFTLSMFALQISPTFSHLSLMIEKMFWETVKFVSLILFMFGTFTISFYVLYVTPSDAKSALPSNITHEYLTVKFVSTVYETFLMVFAGRSPDDIFFAESSYPALSIFVYIVCVLECAVLLLNLLIAIFSHQVEDVYRFKHEIRVIFQLGSLLFLRNTAIFWKKVMMKITRSSVKTDTTEMLVFTTIEKRSPRTHTLE